MVKGERMVCMGFLFWEFLKNFFFFVGYISAGTAFPKPLSVKEEEMYFDLWKSGDMEARNILIERNLRLVVHIAKKYSHSHDVDDLISIGSIGLIKAVSTYDNTKGNRFATYAARCIQNEILMHLRSSKKLQNEVSLEEPIGRDKEGNAISLIDILENEDADTLAIPTEAPTEPQSEPDQTEAEKPGIDYVGNKNTKKFHYASCSSVKKMKESNKYYYTGTREEMIAKGYEPCGNCHP